VNSEPRAAAALAERKSHMKTAGPFGAMLVWLRKLFGEGRK